MQTRKCPDGRKGNTLSPDAGKTMLLPMCFDALRHLSPVVALSLVLYGFSLPAILTRLYSLVDLSPIALGSSDYFALLFPFVLYGELLVIAIVNGFYLALKRSGRLGCDSLSRLLVDNACLRRITGGALFVAAAATLLSFQAWYDSFAFAIVLAVMSVGVPVCLLLESQGDGFTEQEGGSEQKVQYRISVVVWGICSAVVLVAPIWSLTSAWPPYAPGLAVFFLVLLAVFLAMTPVAMLCSSNQKS